MDPQFVYTNSSGKVRVAAVSESTWGRIHWTQLRALGIARGTIAQWVKEGYLFEEPPRVYSVGHRAGPVEADLASALLYAGPGAMLSHRSAAWWWRLTDRMPPVVEVSTPRRCRCRPGVRVHGRRPLPRLWHNHLTVTTIPQTLLDYASQMPFEDLRYVLAEADYHRLINLDEVHAIAGRGKHGATTLLRALAVHWHELARTDSPLERAFLFLVESGGLPRPRVNLRVCGFKVDCYWPEQRVAVELDGGRGHSTERQVRRDHGRDLRLRQERIIVRRYADTQVYAQGEAVLADLRTALATTH